MTDWRAAGICPPDVLLPRAPFLGRFWPVVALDQYTSQPEAWEAAEREIGAHPSTLRLVVPEAFLEETEARSRKVNEAMADYLRRDLFYTLPGSFILVERETQSGKRVGLVASVDLEEYDYAPGSRSLIRATEETVLDRIPPRLKVREQSALELSHVMLLIDDPDDSVLGPLYLKRETLPPVYDVPLLMGGGRVRGWRVSREEDHARLASGLTALREGLPSGGMLYAVGDGNHSLAAAKASWEKQKAGLTLQEQEGHPARYAMVELVNLHSPALLFEPIHRIVFGADRQKLMDVLSPLGPVRDAESPDIVLVGGSVEDVPLALKSAGEGLVTEAVQRLLDAAALPLDYVHGEAALREIAAARNGTGILMPEFPKKSLFPIVQKNGRLPRKTFSMGEAHEKRFYMEARKIT